MKGALETEIFVGDMHEWEQISKRLIPHGAKLQDCEDYVALVDPKGKEIITCKRTGRMTSDGVEEIELEAPINLFLAMGVEPE